MAKVLKLYLLNLYFYTFFLVLSAVTIPALTLFVAACAPFQSRRSTMRRFRRSITWYGRVVLAIASPFVTVRYQQGDLGSQGEPNIFVCNHLSASDAFLMGVLPHEVVQIVNTWPFRIPVLGFYAKFAGYLNIRSMPHEEFLARGAQLLNEGASLIFFPEGTRSVTGRMGSFHSAAFRLALETRAPLVPLLISGNEQIPPKGSPLLHPGQVTLRRLAPIPWAEYRELTAFALKNKVWKIMDRELNALESPA